MQQELFGNLRWETGAKRVYPPLFPHRYLRVRVAYEDLIFFALGLVLTLLAGFCLGVERGKGLANGFSATQEKSPARPKEELQVVSAPPMAVQPSASAASPSGPYAIQLASYLDQRPAEQEAERLRRQGLPARVVHQGRYFELRLVGFRSREEAAPLLSSLRKMYHDGFVKRLSS